MKPSRVVSGLFWAASDLAWVALAVVSLLGFLGPLWLPLDNLTHFRVQYLALLFLLAAILALGRRWWQAVLALIFALLNLALVLPLYVRPLTVRLAVDQPVYRLYSANISRNSTHFDLVSRQIQDYNPDLIVLTEITPAWQASLQPLLSTYPYASLLPEEGYFGIAVVSKYPLVGERVEYFGSSRVASIVTTISLPAGDLVVIGTHPVPPRSLQNITMRNQQMAAIADYAGSLTIPSLVSGDLNSSSWSPFFMEWLRRSGLRDSRTGFGIQPTWPADQQALPRLAMFTTLDHVLVSPEIIVVARTTGAFNGSDHLPVILDFSLAPLTSKDVP